jgi:Tfp pilus assembly protein PilX
MRRNDRGIALVLCILALMVLTGIAVGLMYMTDAETSINSNYRSSQQAYFAALAGVQSVRERMTLANAAPHLITGPATMPGGAGSIVYVTNPANASDTVTLPIITGAGSYADNELCKEDSRIALLEDQAAIPRVRPRSTN